MISSVTFDITFATHYSFVSPRDDVTGILRVNILLQTTVGSDEHLQRIPPQSTPLQAFLSTERERTVQSQGRAKPCTKWPFRTTSPQTFGQAKQAHGNPMIREGGSCKPEDSSS